jgi:hypothetical protein
MSAERSTPRLASRPHRQSAGLVSAAASQTQKTGHIPKVRGSTFFGSGSSCAEVHMFHGVHMRVFYVCVQKVKREESTDHHPSRASGFRQVR